MSCDQYSDIWPYFFYYFWSSWPDCPYPLYLGSTTKSYGDNRVQTLLALEDTSWSASTIKYLEQIGSEYVLMIQEDFFLKQPTNSADIESCLLAMKELGAKYCRLVPDGAQLKEIDRDDWNSFGWIDIASAFRISTQASIWLRQSLIQHLRMGESPWDFEVLGSERTRTSQFGYLSTKWRVLRYDGHGALVRGKWTSPGIRMARKAGLKVLTRPRISYTGNILLNLQRIIFWLVIRTNPRMVRRWNLRHVKIRH